MGIKPRGVIGELTVRRREATPASGKMWGGIPTTRRTQRCPRPCPRWHEMTWQRAPAARLPAPLVVGCSGDRGGDERGIGEAARARDGGDTLGWDEERAHSRDDVSTMSLAPPSMALVSVHGRAKEGRERASSGERGASGSGSASRTREKEAGHAARRWGRSAHMAATPWTHVARWGVFANRWRATT
jgi:hypothetical protein